MSIFLLLAQVATYIPPAVPAAPAVPPATQVESWEMRYRAQCMSEAGIRIIVDSSVRNWATARARTSDIQRSEAALARAIFSNPIDLAGIERGVREQGERSAQVAREIAETQIANLRQLSARDRAIYARSMTTMQPLTQGKRCSATKTAK